jgi:hypothetical protein
MLEDVKEHCLRRQLKAALLEVATSADSLRRQLQQQGTLSIADHEPALPTTHTGQLESRVQRKGMQLKCRQLLALVKTVRAQPKVHCKPENRRLSRSTHASSPQRGVKGEGQHMWCAGPRYNCKRKPNNLNDPFDCL